MLFWLTFIQNLPAINFDSVDNHFRFKTKNKIEIVEVKPIENRTLEPALAQLGGTTVFTNLIIILVALLIISIFAYTKVYVIAPNNEAFVRTGGVFTKSKQVILNGGCVVIPRFHELTRVPLREISIDVERTGKLAVRTQDYLRANMRVTFYVCINAKEEDVLIAAARLSKQGIISEEDIKEALEKRADDAIRAAAKRKSIAEIDSDKLGFADEVVNLIQQDLKKVGLTLNNIAISEIEESDTYDENNFFDAQGVQLRTETIQRSIKQKLEVELINDREKKELELNTKIAIEQQQLAAEKQSLAIQQEKEDAKLKQRKEVEFLKAQTEREIQESQDQEIAKMERNKILQNQAEQESKIAQEEATIAIAETETERFNKEAERAQAEAAVITATEIEQAEREQRLSLIAAEQQAAELRINDQNVVELDVFRRKRQAEIARQAAELEAESIRTLAEANQYKALAEAEGKKALIEAENALNNANRTAELIKIIWPELAVKLPEIVKSLAPQPGIIGDTRIYAFPGANGQENGGVGDINKLLLSTSGLSLIQTLLDEGKLTTLLTALKQLLNSQQPTSPTEPTTIQTEEATEQ